MMKVAIATLAVLTASVAGKKSVREGRKAVEAAVHRKLDEGTPCVDESWSREVDGCNYDELKDAVGEACLTQLFGSVEEATEVIEDACEEGFKDFAVPYEHTIEKKDRSFYREYFNGNSFLNTERQTKDIYDGTIHRLSTTAARINDVYDDIAQTAGISFPSFLSNFKPESCELRAAMCCFVQDRQANDNNGDCDEDYDVKCVDADPADNTDLCYVDASRSPDSLHLADGFAIYGGDDGDGEGAVHCHGLAWSNDPTDTGARYRGNNLFYISKYDHLYTRGYVRNVPLAPMCGCVEKMPAVSRSDCTEMTVAETVTFYFDSGTLSAEFEDVEIAYAACQGANDNNNDLDAYYERLVNQGDADPSELELLREKYVVGDNNCEERIDEFLATKGFQRN